ncbi:unnamed protein product [Linum tenue]|uniref:NADP-dependent oxidoreductase domain-containing protein n=1 Tax=Linum tenue TaxID=586396 RepID=A0AAV0RR39_9ROSI|nr:unnamed protein product [Linum tenue]
MSASVHLTTHNLDALKFNTATTRRNSQRVRIGAVRCSVSTAETKQEGRTVVKNGKDSLDICRIVNGMWQTSGGWGKIERDNAVDAMIKHVDSGLNTFDMADICTLPSSFRSSVLS